MGILVWTFSKIGNFWCCSIEIKKLRSSIFPCSHRSCKQAHTMIPDNKGPRNYSANRTTIILFLYFNFGMKNTLKIIGHILSRVCGTIFGNITGTFTTMQKYLRNLLWYHLRNSIGRDTFWNVGYPQDKFCLPPHPPPPPSSFFYHSPTFFFLPFLFIWNSHFQRRKKLSHLAAFFVNRFRLFRCGHFGIFSLCFE